MYSTYRVVTRLLKSHYQLMHFSSTESSVQRSKVINIFYLVMMGLYNSTGCAWNLATKRFPALPATLIFPHQTLACNLVSRTWSLQVKVLGIRLNFVPAKFYPFSSSAQSRMFEERRDGFSLTSDNFFSNVSHHDLLVMPMSFDAYKQ